MQLSITGYIYLKQSGSRIPNGKHKLVVPLHNIIITDALASNPI